jgi:iron complex outermembrane receptor protein
MVLLCLAIGCSGFTLAHAAAGTPDDLSEFSLEELSGLRVVSVSRRSELLADAAASIYVISGEDIRRSGASTLPEVLRLAPNLQVARVDARNYAITARGFNNAFENKLLVLVDGRTVYTPLFSGVFWDAQDVVLEDVARIEVISGPGATLWGANAVNGVINVITKSAADTQGVLVAAGAGGGEKNAVARYGRTMANGGHYRVYGKSIETDDTRRSDGTPVLTGWRRRQAGFRSDWSDQGQEMTLRGDVYDGALHQADTADIGISGANLGARVSRTLSPDSIVTLDAYWDYTQRSQPNAFAERLHTLSVELQHALQAGPRYRVVYGAGYRVAFDHVENGPAFGFLPGALTLYWGHLFMQNDFALTEALRLTAGLRLENNNYTGVEYLPTLRLAYRPAPTYTLWASASRAVRTPSRIDRDFYSPTDPPVVNGAQRFAITGGPQFVSEVAKVVELGYRVDPSPQTSLSTTAFYGQYDRLRTFQPNPTGPGLTFANGAEGTTRGIESWATWHPVTPLRLSAGLVTQHVQTRLKAGGTDSLAGTGLAASDPSNYAMLRAAWDIAPAQTVDLTLRHTSSLSSPAVPAYYNADLRYGWKIFPYLEMALVGQNLLQKSHAEYGAAAGRSEYERALFVSLRWQP